MKFCSIFTTRFFLAADHGGDAVKGGGHPSDSPVPPEEAIHDAQGIPTTAHGKTAGTADPGVPGSRTNPVTGEEPVKRKDDHPVSPRRRSRNAEELSKIPKRPEQSHR